MERNSSISEDIITKLENEQLGGIMNDEEIFSQEDVFYEGSEDENNEDIIILHIEIQEPLSTLKPILEEKTGEILNNFTFWLQNAQMLEPHKNLVDQCVKGEGLVQINVQVQLHNERINIVDVLKPTEAALARLGHLNNIEDDITVDSKPSDDEQFNNKIDQNNENLELNENEISDSKMTDYEAPITNWIMDRKFKREQMKLKIPSDPNLWTTSHVKYWFTWAAKHFELKDVSLNDWNIPGRQLCNLKLNDFHKKVPHDTGNIFWTHLELLRTCKYVAIQQKTPPYKFGDEVIKIEGSERVDRDQIQNNNTAKNCSTPITMPYSEPYASRSGNNGQIQLWQFLLDILTDSKYLEIICWIGREGEFKLIDPERVAQLWGVRKKKPAMNYEKLSRALRYYYDGDMISKVPGRRFVYKFVCDLKQLIGYDAYELATLVGNNSLHKFQD